MYFDYNATSPLRPHARDAMIDAMKYVGNPTSVHTYGRTVRGHIESTREVLASIFHTSPKNVIFTSGATEANNMVIQNHVGPVLISAIEHDSVYAVRDDVHIIRATNEGVLDLDHLEEILTALKDSENPPLIAILAAHNETGVIQPIEDVLKIAEKHKALTHIDAVQSFCKTTQSYKGATTVAVSAHKIGGPAGVGALIKTDGFYPKPLIRGGGQERSFRSGTENILGIVGFGAAITAALRDDQRCIQEKRDRFEAAFKQISPDVVVFGEHSPRLPGTSNFAMPHTKSEVMLMHFDQKGMAVSSGAACSSGKVKVSRSLLAMGIPESIAKGAVRISIGYQTTDQEIDALIHAWGDIDAKISPSKPHSQSLEEAPCHVAA